MKQNRYYISLYIIIPIIFAGLSILSSIVTFRVTEYFIKRGLAAEEPVLWVSVGIGVITYICSLLILVVILKPVEKFMKEAKKLTILSGNEAGDENRVLKGSVDKLEEFSQVFEQVAHVLTMIDARQHFPDIIAESRAMRSVLTQIMKVAPTDATVLILGESGTGKELVATGIYRKSLRKDKPFITLNCTAVPDGLWESELFGHEKGAFTGAIARKPGKFEIADQGTFFLDEIGDMPLNTQAKILRVLQESEFERVGGNSPIKVDVRFIAATNKELFKMVKEGKFREDLYHRLNVFSIRLPPLRERKEDIPVLTDHFLANAPKLARISSVTLQLLMAYSWRGNVRELKNTLERATVMCEDGVIDPHHLPSDIRKELTEQVIEPLKESLSLDEKLAVIERNLIIEALHKSGGFQVRAAEFLGINPRQLAHRIKKYNIDPKEFKG